MKKIIFFIIVFIVFLFSCFLGKERKVTNIEVFISADDIKASKIKGVRDYIWCIQNGAIHEVNGKKIGYFNGFSDVTTDSDIGPTIYRIETQKGVSQIKKIILERNKGVDELGTSLGSVIFNKGHYLLFYAGLTRINDHTKILPRFSKMCDSVTQIELESLY